MKHTTCRLITGLALVCIPVFPCLAANSHKPINERILLIHATSSGKAPDSEQQPRLSVYEGIVEQLADNGYRIVDKSSAEQCSLQIAATHDIDPHLNKAASFGLKFFAEYTVYFKTSTISKDHDDSKGALVKVNAKIVDNTSCQIVAAKTAESSSSGFTVEDAIDKAGRSAGKKLATTLSTAMEKNLSTPGSGGKIYTIVIERKDGNSDLLPLLSKLEASPAVKAARESESGGGKATFEVIYQGKRDQLDREILRLSAELGWKLHKIRSEGNRSTWKIN